MFYLVLDGSKYIAVREKRTLTGAREYCSHKYQNGVLGSFKDSSDCKELTELMQAEPWNQYYWTGTGSFVCRDRPSLNSKKKNSVQLTLPAPNVCPECPALTWANNQLERQCKSFFICKVNKGNEIYSLLIAPE